jgi:hypothetical protein
LQKKESSFLKLHVTICGIVFFVCDVRAMLCIRRYRKMNELVFIALILLMTWEGEIVAFRTPQLASSRLVGPLTLNMLDSGMVASKLKIVKYGATSSEPDVAVEVTDRNLMERFKTITVTRLGGIGLDLAEYNSDGTCGTVLVNGVFEGSNAEQCRELEQGGFQEGDILCSIAGVTAIKGTQTASSLAAGEPPLSMKLEGLTLDNTIDRMGYFGEYASVAIRVKRLSQRSVVTVKLRGPQGEDEGEVEVLSGYGVNLRTVLQSSGRRLYDPRTYRFDSPYQQGDCGGEGTCGTCVVSVLSGASVLNGRNRVENKALNNQNAPPNYRWACRVWVAEEPEDVGAAGVAEREVVVKLRPQTTMWDGSR